MGREWRLYQYRSFYLELSIEYLFAIFPSSHVVFVFRRRLQTHLMKYLAENFFELRLEFYIILHALTVQLQ